MRYLILILACNLPPLATFSQPEMVEILNEDFIIPSAEGLIALHAMDDGELADYLSDNGFHAQGDQDGISMFIKYFAADGEISQYVSRGNGATSINLINDYNNISLFEAIDTDLKSSNLVSKEGKAKYYRIMDGETAFLIQKEKEGKMETLGIVFE